MIKIGTNVKSKIHDDLLVWSLDLTDQEIGLLYGQTLLSMK